MFVAIILVFVLICELQCFMIILNFLGALAYIIYILYICFVHSYLHTYSYYCKDNVLLFLTAVVFGSQAPKKFNIIIKHCNSHIKTKTSIIATNTLHN